MKNFFEINRALVAKKKIIMIIMAVALYALPAVAQNMEFRSTSTMQGSGNYVAPVTAVGATSAASEATTTYSPAKAPSGPRRGFIDPNNPGNQSNESPIGDALIPLMGMALAWAMTRMIRRKKANELRN